MFDCAVHSEAKKNNRNGSLFFVCTGEIMPVICGELQRQVLLTVEIRRLHKLAPFVRREPGSMSEMGILQQL